jgi:hypothetical protein
MKVELFPPDSETAPRHWVRHDQAFAMMLGPAQLSGARSVPRWKIRLRGGRLFLKTKPRLRCKWLELSLGDHEFSKIPTTQHKFV